MFDEEYIKRYDNGTTEFQLKYNAFISDKSPTTDLTLRNHIDKEQFKTQVEKTKSHVRKQKDFIGRMKSKIQELDEAIYFNTEAVN